MNFPSAPRVPKYILDLANQWFELDRKLQQHPELTAVKRHADNLGQLIKEDLLASQEIQIVIENPQGQRYDETKTDCECVGIAGENPNDLVVSEVIKPMIRIKHLMTTQIIQRAVIVAMNKKAYRELQNEDQPAEPSNKQAEARPKTQTKTPKEPKNNNSKPAKGDKKTAEPHSTKENMEKLRAFLRELGVPNPSNTELKKVLGTKK